MGYLIAAYLVGVGGVVAYAAWLALERRRLRALLAGSRQNALAGSRQNAVDKPATGEV